MPRITGAYAPFPLLALVAGALFPLQAEAREIRSNQVVAPKTDGRVSGAARPECARGDLNEAAIGRYKQAAEQRLSQSGKLTAAESAEIVREVARHLEAIGVGDRRTTANCAVACASVPADWDWTISRVEIADDAGFANWRATRVGDPAAGPGFFLFEDQPRTATVGDIRAICLGFRNWSPTADRAARFFVKPRQELVESEWRWCRGQENRVCASR